MNLVVKNENSGIPATGMNRSITLEKSQIEAWGCWWIQWQEQKKDQLRKEAKERIRKQTMSPRAFVSEHLVLDAGVKKSS